MHEPAIRHAVIALGSLHERFEARDPSVSRSSDLEKIDVGFALEQYTRAIGCLLKPAEAREQQALDVVLAACILFTCFETLRGHHGSALSHVKNGINMLREFQAATGSLCKSSTILTTSSIPMVPYGTLQVMFARFDCQSIRLGGDNGPIDYVVPSEAEPGFGASIPSKFKSIREARNSMEYHERESIRFLSRMESDNMNDLEAQLERRRRLGNLSTWFAVFKQFLDASATALSATDMQATRLLQTRYLVLLDMLSVTDLANEMAWDEHIDLYARIVDLVVQIVSDPTYSNRLNGTVVPVFALDSGVAGPLFHVIRRCRDPRIRREAISLWHATPRQEGVWDGVLALRVAERMMEVEEGGLGEVRCCADIPLDSRIAALGVQIHQQQKRAEVIFSKRWKLRETLHRDPSRIIHEVLTW
ncbi:MAG: hypothetical protein M1822_001691 [Bathelium mastoideum]|nr:MAG: hypothetical protein M1822_001691 [Bathelium mastoideum]